MSDLEQRIKEAAENKTWGRGKPLFNPADILALLAEKDAEIERLTRERDEWKRIAGQYRAEHAEWGCITSGNDVCDTCKAYDVLAGMGE